MREISGFNSDPVKAVGGTIFCSAENIWAVNSQPPQVPMPWPKVPLRAVIRTDSGSNLRVFSTSRKSPGVAVQCRSQVEISEGSAPAVAMALRGGVQGSGPQASQWLVLLYLGLVPTALGFYLWNKGASLVKPAFLASINNLKVPLAVVLSWTVFGEEADYQRVLLGLALVVIALFLAGKTEPKKN